MQAPVMPKFSKGTSDKIIKILAELEEGLHKKIENITVDIINNKPVDEALYFGRKNEQIFYRVVQTVSTSFSTRLGLKMEEIALCVLEAGGSTDIKTKKEAKPVDLKFTHPDGHEYWIEMKSIFGQNKSNNATIEKEKKKAKKAGKKFLLCVYNEDKEDGDETKSGRDFWNFIGHDDDTWANLSKILTDEGERFNLSEIIRNKIDELTKP